MVQYWAIATSNGVVRKVASTVEDVERNKALIRRYFAALDERDLDGITALLATDCVFHLQ